MTTSSSSLFVRNLDSATAARIRRAAQLRGMTLAEYLYNLVDFHDAARSRADAGDDGWQMELETRGLHTVRE